MTLDKEIEVVERAIAEKEMLNPEWVKTALTTYANKKVAEEREQFSKKIEQAIVGTNDIESLTARLFVIITNVLTPKDL